MPTCDPTIAAQSFNYRYSTNHQVVIDADTRRVVVLGRPLAGNHHDCRAWEESGAKAAVGKTLTIADGGYPGTGLAIPHRRERGQAELPEWKAVGPDVARADHARSQTASRPAWSRPRAVLRSRESCSTRGRFSRGG